VQPDIIGKPNVCDDCEALDTLEAQSETTVMGGDCVDTDVVSGLEGTAGIRSMLSYHGLG
jgi:ribonucleotide monophosphatase NagD (HAD superfamily)